MWRKIGLIWHHINCDVIFMLKNLRSFFNLTQSVKSELKHKKNNFEDRKQEHLHKHFLYLVKVLNKAQRKFMDEVRRNLEFNTTVDVDCPWAASFSCS